MNYRHAFHAGNFADVLKHVCWSALLEHLQRKDAPYCYLDTHAGRGDYPLGAAETQRAGEFRDGIARLLDAPGRHPSRRAISSSSVDSASRTARSCAIPDRRGSHSHVQRADDRAALCELEPREADALACVAAPRIARRRARA